MDQIFSAGYNAACAAAKPFLSAVNGQIHARCCQHREIGQISGVTDYRNIFLMADLNESFQRQQVGGKCVFHHVKGGGHGIVQCSAQVERSAVQRFADLHVFRTGHFDHLPHRAVAGSRYLSFLNQDFLAGPGDVGKRFDLGGVSAGQYRSRSDRHPGAGAVDDASRFGVRQL